MSNTPAPAGFGDLNSAARVTEAMRKIASDVVTSVYPRPKYAEVLEIDVPGRTVVVQYPEEAIAFRVPCGAYMPLNMGQTVRIFGPSGARYVDEVLGPASFDGTIGGAAETFVCADEAAMLACGAVRGDFAIRTDLVKTFILQVTPATTLGNWVEFLDPGMEAIAANVVANHVSALNPHPIYLTEAEGDARYVSTGAIAAAITAHEIATDPHSQYVSIIGGDTMQPTVNSVIPLTIRGHATQAVDLLDIVDGGGVTRVWVTAAGALSGNGSGLTTLNASNVSSGTLDVARLHSSVWTSANDGASSGLDADLLDGQHGSYYLPSGSYTAADVLAKLLTVDGAASTLDADLLDGQHGSYYLDWTNVTNKPDPVVTVTLTGDVTGTADATLTDLASGTVSVTTTIAANSVALGTDTTGDYIATLTGTSNQVTVTGAGTEGRTPVLSLPQDIHSAATPTFARITLSQATGTAPITVSSTTVVSNLNADLLDGQHGSYFAPSALLETLLGDMLRVGFLNPALTSVTSIGRASNVVTVGTDVAHALLVGDVCKISDVTGFDGFWTVATVPTTTTLTFAQTGSNVTYGAITPGEIVKMPVPVWSGASTTYRHNMFWIVTTTSILNYIDSDLSGRFDALDSRYEVHPGDWVIATDPAFDPDVPAVDHTLSEMTFQVLPFSSETLAKQLVSIHASDPYDPHSAAGYLTFATADPVYAPTIHYHTGEIDSAISAHEALDDPHPGYLTPLEGIAAFASLTHLHTGTYEPYGTVSTHAAATDPHPQYQTQAESDALYALVGHLHDSRYALISQIPTVPLRVRSTDTGGTANNHWIGSVDPMTSFSADVLVGDIWDETFNVTVPAPAAPSNFTGSATTGTSVVLTWDAYVSGVGQTEIQLDRETSVGSGSWTNILTDTTSAYAVTYTDTGRTERTAYSYRIRGKNAAGYGAYSTLNITTANDAPAAPTSQSGSALSSTSVRISWTASTATDLHATQPYEVFINGVLTATDTASPYDFTGLVENTLYTVGVRAKDSLNVTSATVTATATTSNGTPPAPSGLATSGITWAQGTLTWSAVTGISDLASYEVFKGGVSQGTTTSLTWTFTGLSASTAYTVGVRTVDTGALTSSTTTTTITTIVNPDTTPPGNVTLTSFKPETSYGNMVLRFTTPSDSDFNYYTVQRSTDGASWVDDVSASSTPSAAVVRTLAGGPYSAGQTVYVRVKTRDATGNWNTPASPTSTYTLITSPTEFNAASAKNWSGSSWNMDQPMQGYWTTGPSNTGCWFYGTAPQSIYNSGLRTITGGSIYMQRQTSGSSALLYPRLIRHTHESKPAGAPTAVTGEETALGVGLRTPAYDPGADEAWEALPSGWAASVVAGTYKGFATYASAGQGSPSSGQYGTFSSLTDLSISGKLSIDHLG